MVVVIGKRLAFTKVGISSEINARLIHGLPTAKEAEKVTKQQRAGSANV